MLGFKVVSSKSTPFELRELHTLRYLVTGWTQLKAIKQGWDISRCAPLQCLFCRHETKSSLSAKSVIACFKNVWLLSVSWNEHRWCFALRRFASTINLLSLFTKQSQNLQNNSHLGVEVNSEEYSCSIRVSNFWKIWLFNLRHHMLID